MGTQGTGRKRSTKKERSTAEDDALNLIAREAEARLAAKRAARAEAREIRMRELERQQKEIFQVQKKYYGLDTKVDERADSKWGDIEQWMEDSERYSRSSRIHTLSDDDERMSVGSRGSVRSDLDAVGAYGGGVSSSLSHKKSKKKKKHKHKDRDRNGYDDDYSVMSSRSSRLSDESRVSRSSRLDLTSSRLSDDSRLSRASRLDLQPASYASSDLYSFNGLSSSRNSGSAFNGYQSSLYEESLCSGSRRASGSTLHPLEYSSYRSSGSRSGSRASSRANSARTSPVDNCGSVASFLRSAASSSGLPRDLDDVTIPDFSDVDDRDYLEKGSRAASSLTAATLTSLGGTSSRRGSGETAITVDAETSIREIKEIHELKDQIQDVEIKYTQNLKEAKDALAEVEEKYRKAMVSNAQLDNEKNNLMYQVDTLKDSLMELEELLSESQRSYEEKVKEFEREKHAHSVLQFQFNEMKETLKQSEELLNEIRLLRIKQEGFVREVSDLQETVEWKDKKIAALERQKEYTDAIRIERDELREEVVKLKDILKKHGIVLGPDLNINGVVGEAEVVGSPSADAASQPPPDAQTPPTEGNSLLGITEETHLRSSGEEEMDPQQHGEMFEDAKENHLSCETICDVAEVSAEKTAHEEKPAEEQETCSAAEGDNVQESCLTEAKDETDRSPGPEGVETSSENNVPEAKKPEEADSGETSNPDSGETETRSSGVDSNSHDITESSKNILEEQENKQEEVAESNSKETESAPQQESEQDVVTKSSPDESVQTVPNTEPQQEPENVGEAENDEEEETSSKTQPQAAASGKKKRKKRKGKKKGGANEDKSQQKDGTKKEKDKTGKDIESATSVKETTADPDVDGSVFEKLKESEVEQDKSEKVVQDKEQTLKTGNAEEVETSSSFETVSNMETQKETSVDRLTDYQNKVQSVETETAAEVSTESSSQVETLKESRTDPNNDDEQNQDRTLETEQVEEVESIKSPVPEVSIGAPKLIDDSKDIDDSDNPDKECTVSEDNSERGANISANGHTESEAVDGAKDEDQSVVEMKSECTSNDPETSESNSEEISEVESHAPSNDASEAMIQPESKDTTPATPPSTDDVTDHLKSSSGSEPSELSAAVNSGSDDTPDQVSEETTETVRDDEEPVVETEQESFSSGVISPSRDEDEKEELNGDSEEPEGLVEPEISSHAEEKGSFDGGSLTENTYAVHTEKSLLETETQAEEVDEEESQTLNYEHQTAESNAEGSSETEVIKPTDMLNEPDSPTESTETGSCVEQDDITEESAVAEDQEHKNSPDDQQSETHLPVEEQLREAGRDKPEDNGSSRANVQASDEEDEEDEEGQSFDFEDMDVEAALATSLPNDPKEEEVEEGVEVTSDEGVCGSSGLCQSNTESNEHEQDGGENNERCSTDEVNQVDTLEEVTDTICNEEASSEQRENTENVCEKQENVSKDEVVVADEPDTEEGNGLVVEEMGDVAENINQAASLPADKGSDVVKNESQGGDLVLPKSSDQVVGSKEPPQTRADGKKNSKKGKAKGKEECKMS